MCHKKDYPMASAYGLKGAQLIHMVQPKNSFQQQQGFNTVRIHSFHGYSAVVDWPQTSRKRRPCQCHCTAQRARER